jgi:hypothetical protein
MNIRIAEKNKSVRSRYRADDDLVLRSMPLRPGMEGMATSRFGDDSWDLRPAVFQTRARYVPKAIEFGLIDCPIERLTSKEYIYAWLNERLPDRMRRLPPLSVPSELNSLIRFMRFIRQRLGSFDISRINQALLDDYRMSLLKAASPASESILNSLRPVIQLHRFAPYLTSGGLPDPPWSGRPLGTLAGLRQKDAENRTARIPEPVMAAMLSWCLKYVNVFADDIFAARAEWDSLLKIHRQRSTWRQNAPERVATWINVRRDQGRGIPVWTEPPHVAGTYKGVRPKLESGEDVVNIQLISLQCGVSPGSIHGNDKIRQQLNTALNELGSERGGMDTPISIDPDTSAPWRGRFDIASLGKEEKFLQTAAYIMCAYLTGMRDSEVQAMAPGCLRRTRSADGLVERISINSLIFKQQSARGKPGEWITIEPVGRALQVAEKLSERYRDAKGKEDLWIGLDSRSRAPSRGMGNILRQLNSFRAHLDRQYGEHDAPAIPQVDGRSWWFTTLQFRRTVAWYIANRPFGAVAGKIQYKHASVAMFEGYAGSSPSGFRQEVEQQRLLGQLDDVVGYYEAHSRGERQAGPGAVRLTRECDHATKLLDPLPGQIVDQRRLKAMLSHLARTLHVGHLNDCFFDRTTALCLMDTIEEKTDGPILSRCAPDRCPNSCISERHLPAWNAAITETDALLQNKRLPPLQRAVLRRENERMRKLIAPLCEDQKDGG